MLVLKDSIEIKTTPDKIFDFFARSEETYTDWHPDHVAFRWVKGTSLKQGSIGYFEEYLHGELHKSKVVYTKVVPNNLIEFSITHPIWRLFYPKTVFTIEQKKDTCIFCATTYLRPGWLFERLAKERNAIQVKAKCQEKEQSL